MKHLKTRLLSACFVIFMLAQPVQAATQLLVPVGRVVGLELLSNTVSIAAFAEDSIAEAAGLRAGDRIVSIDGKMIQCAQDVRAALSASDGTVEIRVQRGDKCSAYKLTPTITADGPKLGIFLRQGVTGIGTITYYDPQSHRFGTLGHGVNTPGGGLLAMTEGKCYRAGVASVRKGKCGDPGQLVGSLMSQTPIGTLSRNTARGVFGTLDMDCPGEAVPVGSADGVKTGNATILSTIAGEAVQEYSVEILKIYPAARTNGRNMLIKVTDPALLETTGGIVQGMSGSPIIQDGKLVGAVTHVLVNDPTTGYGIFIENMLDAAA